MKQAFTIIILCFFCGCQSARPAKILSSDFRSPRIEKELKFYVSTHSNYATNHFYVGAIKLDHGKLVKALVYWQEEQVILPYAELEADAKHDSQAWGGHELKLGRDTVATQKDIAGSDYLITHQQWRQWAGQCVSNGQAFCILAKDARWQVPFDPQN